MIIHRLLVPPESIQAEAYTVGRDIYFGAGRYRPETEGGNHLLAHELTHVEQPTAGKEPFEGHVSPSARFIIGSSTDRLEQEAESKADSFSRRSKSGGVPTPDHSGEIRRAEWNSLTDNPITNTIGAGLRKGVNFVAGQIERFAPGAVRFFRNIRDYFKNAISKGVDGLFGGIVSSLREKGLVGTLESMVGSFATGALHAVGGFAAGQCAAMGKLAEYLLEITVKLGSGVLDQAKKGFEAIRGPLEDLWTQYGAPALDFVKNKLKGIWKEVEEYCRQVLESAETAARRPKCRLERGDRFPH